MRKELKRSEERSEVLTTVSPEELASFAPIGRLVATDESAESGILTELLIQCIGLMKLAAPLETAALAAPSTVAMSSAAPNNAGHASLHPCRSGRAPSSRRQFKSPARTASLWHVSVPEGTTQR